MSRSLFFLPTGNEILGERSIQIARFSATIRLFSRRTINVDALGWLKNVSNGHFSFYRSVQNFYNWRRGEVIARSMADLLEARSRRQQYLWSLSVASWFIPRIFIESYFIISTPFCQITETSLRKKSCMERRGATVVFERAFIWEAGLRGLPDVLFTLHSSLVHSLTAVAPP